MTLLLQAAFGALGRSPSWQAQAIVARGLLGSGDEETLALFEDPLNESWPAIEASANAALDGGGGLVALDLIVAVGNPDWAMGMARDVVHYDEHEEII